MMYVENIKSHVILWLQTMSHLQFTHFEVFCCACSYFAQGWRYYFARVLISVTWLSHVSNSQDLIFESSKMYFEAVKWPHYDLPRSTVYLRLSFQFGNTISFTDWHFVAAAFQRVHNRKLFFCFFFKYDSPLLCHGWQLQNSNTLMQEVERSGSHCTCWIQTRNGGAHLLTAPVAHRRSVTLITQAPYTPDSCRWLFCMFVCFSAYMFIDWTCSSFAQRWSPSYLMEIRCVQLCKKLLNQTKSCRVKVKTDSAAHCLICSWCYQQNISMNCICNVSKSF